MQKKPALIVFLLGSLLLHSALVRADESLNFTPIPQQTLLDYLGGKTNFTLIDARTPEEYAAGHIWGASNIPHDSDIASATVLPYTKDSALVVYCKSGKRAEALQASLLAQGYSNVRVLGPAQMLWAGELPVFNCGAVEAPEPALLTTVDNQSTTGATQ